VELRRINGIQYISKGCKQPEACLSNYGQNWAQRGNGLTQCNQKADSTCHYCCFSHLCNAASISRSNFTSCQFVRLTFRLSDLKHLEQLRTVLILAEWLEKTVQKGRFLQVALKPGLKNKFADKIALKNLKPEIS